MRPISLRCYLFLEQRLVVKTMVIPRAAYLVRKQSDALCTSGLGYKLGFVFHIQSQIAIEALKRMR